MILTPLRLLPPKKTSIFLMVAIILRNVHSEPQEAAVFENVASQALAVGGNMAEMVGNAGMMSKNTDFEMPFVKAKSESKAGTGAALRNDDDDDSSEEDRRKRAADFQTQDDALVGEEFLLPSPLVSQRQHFHRDKRSPCHYGGGGTGGGAPADDADYDIQQRRRAYYRKRKAAAKRAKSKKTATGGGRKKLINDAVEHNNQMLVRRKRQSEVNDLNQTTQTMGSDIAQHAQQFAEKIRNIFENFKSSMNDMVEKLKQQFSNQNASNTMEI